LSEKGWLYVNGSSRLNCLDGQGEGGPYVLPRRHILDVSLMIKDEKEVFSMATLSLAIDAMKYMHHKPKKDHLVEALELNEFICFMFPAQRPKNRSLLYHTVSDLLGLLMYGVPSTRKYVIENIETINYSEENMETYPVIEVWNSFKANVYTKKHGGEDVVEGFIKKIQVEIDTIERYPFVEDIFLESKKRLDEWLPSLASYYDESKKKIRDAYDKWWELWRCKGDTDSILRTMVKRLAAQAEREFDIIIEKDAIFSSIKSNVKTNKHENEHFSKWYKEGMKLLLKI
jgi:hypothetical protein